MESKGHHVAKIAVLYIQRRDPEARPERGKEGEQNKKRQKKYFPARPELIPDHHDTQDGETNQKIDKRNDNGRSRYDQSRKINLSNEAGTADEAIRGIG